MFETNRFWSFVKFENSNIVSNFVLRASNLIVLRLLFILAVLTGVFSIRPIPAYASEPAVSASQDPQQMLDFNLVGYGANGRKTWEVDGASMDMLQDEVNISDITAHLYGSAENMVLRADNGSFDKGKGIVHLKKNIRAITDSGAQLKTNSLDWSQKEELISTHEQVHILKGNMTAVANGLQAHPQLKQATLEKDVVMTIEDKDKKDGAVPSAGLKTGKVIITCDGPMELDYEKHFAVFEKNVRIEQLSDQGTMYADMMTAYFNPAAKQIDRIEAYGHVKIIRGENTTLSEGAIFTVAEKKMVLTGRPKLVLTTEEVMNVSP